MSYIGAEPTTASFPFDQFSGNGSTTAFTLTYAPASATSIIVAISGVVQNPNLYSIVGSTLTFSPAPPTGTNNISVLYLGLPVQIGTPTPGSRLELALGSAANPSLTFLGDTNTGIFSPSADTIAFVEGGTEAMRIDSSANVGIGTSSPGYALDIRRGAGVDAYTLLAGNNNGTTGGLLIGQDTAGLSRIFQFGANPLTFWTNNTEQARITSAGLFQFNSGYGSVATAFGCRAWVNFNGTGTVAIRASGNVSSITDNGTGDYTVNFTTAMSDANYSFALNGRYGNGEYGMQYGMQSVTTTAIRVSQIYTNGVYYDAPHFCVEIFR